MTQLSDVPALQINSGQGEGQDNVHHDYLLSKLPSPLKDAPVSRLLTMADSTVDFPEWYVNARAIDRLSLIHISEPTRPY